jgi:hypothetical protein
MIGTKRRSNRLNLMRVMPPKGEENLAMPMFRAWLFIFLATDEHGFSRI